MNTKDFKGKVAFITGGSSGIGRATVQLLCEAGAHVAVADVLVKQGEDFVSTLNSQGHSALFVQCDVGNETDIQNAINATIKKFGRLDYAFNNAGVEGTPSPTAECSNENWDRTININLRGVWWCMKYQLQHMLKQGAGSIVNCSSIAGTVGFAGLPAYVASKHAVVGLTKTAALEYAQQNIRVNAVCPGVIHTPMIDRFTKGDETAAKGMADGAPMGRMGRPEEIATAAMWLMSSDSSFATGQAIVVDGGWTVR